MKLIAKYFIKGQIKAVTGLHIGGSKTALDIGGIDSNVIKNASGIPYIPGSSLKGKLRSMLAKEDGSEKPENDNKTIKEIFGESPSASNKEGLITRIIVRDSILSNAYEMLNKEGEFSELELDYTEGKWENTIDRKTGTAAGAGPRQIERVPAGAIFDFELIYNVFDDNKKEEHLTEIKKAIRLLQDDYIGGSGSRGYGKIEFINIKHGERTVEQYKVNEPVTLETFEL
ncbi:MAG: type III-A CRISPR-associated RAMP protein Csm3 [Ignavibacteriae bacterium]|nr:type III-A CRISPR-associated RAMP protein Csm3 [Ignavibacteriota bacterium]NOH00230.1 type III-A CRISPR-associated RAMP protein Csm3 [Ignavibacteriota bacterium]